MKAGCFMRKRSARLIADFIYSLIGLAILISVSCGGGGGSEGNNTIGTTTSTTTTTSVTPTNTEFQPLDFPFAEVSQVRGIGSFAAPNWNSDQPHSGLDVYTYDDRGYNRVNILSPTQGTVTRIEFQSHPPWHLIAPAIYIQINSEWGLSIVIEPGTNDPLIAEQQRQAVNVQVGQVVSKGSLLGQIVLDPTTDVTGGIHMILQNRNRQVCPYSHSTEAAKRTYEQLMSLPGSQPRNGPICYAEEIL
jgi:hypothetical protein